jgi:hypothetical protein
MSCEEELNALWRAERELNLFREQHSAMPDTPILAGDASGPASADAEADALRRLAELTAAVAERKDAYDSCRNDEDGRTDMESLVYDATDAPLGGRTGPRNSPRR